MRDCFLYFHSLVNLHSSNTIIFFAKNEPGLRDSVQIRDLAGQRQLRPSRTHASLSILRHILSSRHSHVRKNGRSDNGSKYSFGFAQAGSELSSKKQNCVAHKPPETSEFRFVLFLREISLIGRPTAARSMISNAPNNVQPWRPNSALCPSPYQS